MLRMRSIDTRTFMCTIMQTLHHWRLASVSTREHVVVALLVCLCKHMRGFATAITMSTCEQREVR